MKLALMKTIPTTLATCLFLSAQTYAATVEKKPNIVYILADDMGYADAGFNGCKQIETPNLDRLAKAGTILSSFYVQPLCSPTRSSLMTGRYVAHTGVYTIVRPHAPWGCRWQSTPWRRRSGRRAMKLLLPASGTLANFNPPTCRPSAASTISMACGSG